MKINQVLKKYNNKLGSENELEIILSYLLEKPKSWLISHSDYALSPDLIIKLEKAIKRRSKNEPLDYILGKTNFCGRDFVVNKDVLIPRPETEYLIEIILKEIATNKNIKDLKIIDVGTGSGAIAISLASELHDKKLNPRIFASEISPKALAIAQRNAKIHNVKIKFIETSLLSKIVEKFDIIVANLPYIPSYYLEKLDLDIVDYEPNIALDGGPDGTDLIKQLLLQAKNKLSKEGLIFLEIWHDQGEILQNYASKIFPSSQIEIKKDLAGHNRFFILKNKS